MARRRAKGRPVNGILVVNKPIGMTSNDTLQKVKRLFQAQKAGHTGSLDKPASGVLPLCFGEATKLSGYLLDSDKEYITECRLGSTTTTGDAAGEIKEQFEVPSLNEQALKTVLDTFIGNISQIPPMYSALKHKGERLYKLAYEGKEVEREARPVTIHEISLLDFKEDQFCIQVRCSKGTYIRTLVEDIGYALGCGSHVTSLKRTMAGPFTTEHYYSLDQLSEKAAESVTALDGCLLPLDKAVEDFNRVDLIDSVAYYLQQGQAVTVPHAPTSGQVRLYNETGTFLGMGEILEDGRVAPRRLFKIAEK